MFGSRASLPDMLLDLLLDKSQVFCPSVNFTRGVINKYLIPPILLSVLLSVMLSKKDGRRYLIVIWMLPVYCFCMD